MNDIIDSAACEWLKAIICGLVADPTKVHVVPKPHLDGITFTVSVALNDHGQLVGKKGHHARSLRTLLRAAGMPYRRVYMLDILEL